MGHSRGGKIKEAMTDRLRDTSHKPRNADSLLVKKVRIWSLPYGLQKENSSAEAFLQVFFSFFKKRNYLF